VCDWLVRVKVSGNMVVRVTCKTKQKRKWKTHDKVTTRTTTIATPTIIIIIITTNKMKKTFGTNNGGQKICIISCLYQHNFDKQPR
jgi:hypothetical protein